MTVKEGTFPSVNFAENGLQAAALGLNVDDANDKPYLKAVPNASETEVTFNFFHGTALDGVITPTGIGNLPVKFAVEYANDANFTGSRTTDPTPESSVSVDLPTGSDKKVRYYRPKFTFE